MLAALYASLAGRDDLGLAGTPVAHATGLPGSAEASQLASDRRRDDFVAIEVSLRYDDQYLEAVAERESHADVLSLRPVFAPRPVAAIGARRRDSSVGNAVVRHLLAAGFSRPVYPVNPHAGEIAGVPAYPSVSALPEVPDLAVMAIPGSPSRQPAPAGTLAPYRGEDRPYRVGPAGV